MVYRSVMKEDYDKKIRFHNKKLFCYSKKKFKRDHKGQDYGIFGEIVKREQDENSAAKVQIYSEQYRVLKQGTKSRFLYWEAGYLCTDDGSYIIVLKHRLPFFLLILLLAAALAGVLWFSLFRQPDVPVIAPPPVDSNVGKIEGDDSKKKDSEEGGGAVTLTYSLDAKLSLSTGNIKMYFLNPNASNQDITLTLYLMDGEDQVKIAESGRIQPGYGLAEMRFIEDSAVLSEGLYEGVFLVSFFDSETSEKALVESNITDVILEVAP